MSRAAPPSDKHSSFLVIYKVGNADIFFFTISNQNKFDLVAGGGGGGGS